MKSFKLALSVALISVLCSAAGIDNSANAGKDDELEPARCHSDQSNDQLWVSGNHWVNASRTKRAIRCFRILADRGDASAQSGLGLMYFGENKLSEAAKWFRVAAQNGANDAQYFYGLFLLEGIGIDRDPEAAIHWLTMAAEADVARAQYELGKIYFQGIGTEQNIAKAIVLFRKAAKNGQKASMMIIGTVYQEGFGVPQDLIEAYKWYYMAKQVGAGNAADKLDQLESQLTPEEVSEAKQRAQQGMSQSPPNQ